MTAILLHTDRPTAAPTATRGSGRRTATRWYHVVLGGYETPKDGAAIWYSRSLGKGEDGESTYARLITFADGLAPTAEPLPDYVRRALGA